MRSCDPPESEPPSTNFMLKNGCPSHLADFVNGHDVRMIQAGHGLGLGPESLHEIRRRKRAVRYLHRHDPVDLGAGAPCRRCPCRPAPPPPAIRSGRTSEVRLHCPKVIERADPSPRRQESTQKGTSRTFRAAHPRAKRVRTLDKRPSLSNPRSKASLHLNEEENPPKPFARLPRNCAFCNER